MEKRILEILLELQNDMKTLQDDMKTVKTEILPELQIDMKTVSTDVSELQKDMKPVKANIQEIKETVNRIEVSQTEDVIGLLKQTKKKTDFEADYINNRITEMDKRLFQLEKRIEN
ncbi:hypothetical protein P9265_01450 [Schinkia azotoformans]|uniref:hypothetical protein n=1 Tax=Schinkia azotoformans TaxID=1454 RepID=UPI002E1A2D89|nr:hypothetical protein [Schinkia azotoformans]